MERRPPLLSPFLGHTPDLSASDTVEIGRVGRTLPVAGEPCQCSCSRLPCCLPTRLSPLAAALRGVDAADHFDYGICCVCIAGELYYMPGCLERFPGVPSVQDSSARSGTSAGALDLYQWNIDWVGSFVVSGFCLIHFRHHWFQKELDRLAYTFGRKITGIHNTTYVLSLQPLSLLSRNQVWHHLRHNRMHHTAMLQLRDQRRQGGISRPQKGSPERRIRQGRSHPPQPRRHRRRAVHRLDAGKYSARGSRQAGGVHVWQCCESFQQPTPFSAAPPSGRRSVYPAHRTLCQLRGRCGPSGRFEFRRRAKSISGPLVCSAWFGTSAQPTLSGHDVPAGVGLAGSR